MFSMQSRQTAYCFLNCSMRQRLHYGKWSIVELPLLPKVAFVHKTMKWALRDCEHEISKEYFGKINYILSEIRKVNWNALNTHGIDFSVVQQPKKLLEELLECEQDLPKPLEQKLEDICLFSSLKDAIDCLSSRSGLK